MLSCAQLCHVVVPTHSSVCCIFLHGPRDGDVEGGADTVALEAALWGLLELLCVGAARSEGYIAEVRITCVWLARVAVAFCSGAWKRHLAATFRQQHCAHSLLIVSDVCDG